MNPWDAFLSVVKGTPGKNIGTSFPIEWTGYTKVRDVIALIDAICDVYDNQAFAPLPDGTTFCNQGVTYVAEAMGCKDFTGKNADEMVSFISASRDWSPIPIEKSQEQANQGSLLIAGLDSKALGQSHGHVVVIRPGKTVYSGKWSTNLCPRVLNIGAENFLARAKKGPLTNQPAGLNESFQPLPKIWVWRPSL
jgi:hypothetical protein